MKRRLLDSLLIKGRIESVDVLGPRMRRIRLGGPPLRGLDWNAGQQVRVQVGGLAVPLDWLTGLRRTYSIWDYDGFALELCVFDHGVGPGSAWARTAAPGDEVLISKPQGDFTLRDSAFHLFVGEETASVAFGPMIRKLPAAARAYAVIEVAEPEDQLPLDGDIVWRHRGEAPAHDSTTLRKAVAELDFPIGTAYLAGEARTIQAVRKHLVEERNWPRRSVLTKPFWTPGKTGME